MRQRNYLKRKMDTIVFLVLSLLIFINQVPDLKNGKLKLEMSFLINVKKRYVEFKNETNWNIPDSIISNRKKITVKLNKNASNNVFLTLGINNGSLCIDPNITAMAEEALFAQSTFITVKSAYVSGRGSFCINDTYIKYEKPSEEYYSQRTGTLMYECSELIHCAGMLSRSTWGHVVIDLMSATLYVPENIRRRSYVVGAKVPGYYNEALKVIGFEDWQIISTMSSDWIYANTFYTVVEPRAYVNHFGFTLKEIYNMSVRIYHTDLIKPTRFCLMNRQKCYNKHFLNFNDIVNSIEKEWPSYKWEKISDQEKNMELSIKLFASIKFLFCALGSNSIKSVFMHPHSIIVGGLSETLERVTMAIAMVNDLYISAFAVPGMLHWGRAVSLNIELAMEGMRAGIHLLEKGKWPSTPKVIDY